jgi:signal peptidase I
MGALIIVNTRQMPQPRFACRGCFKFPIFPNYGIFWQPRANILPPAANRKRADNAVSPGALARSFAARKAHNMSKSKSSGSDKSRGGERSTHKEEGKPADGGWRETVESIAMAVILALLFRGFVAEAFVIPTGSMAPTLRGRHKDVECPECGLWYQVGASQEMNRDDNRQTGDVIAGTCPSCRFTQPLNQRSNANDGSFSGDRIIVSKFVYDFSEPQRWDVIVFKFPGDATQNYIKRLIGLPGETVRIQGGNIWVRQGRQGAFQIARKPSDKLVALLQLVSDSDHISQRILDAKWPLEWFEGQPYAPPEKSYWSVERTGPHSVAFQGNGQATSTQWLRFRRIVPTEAEWTEHLLANPPTVPADVQGIEGELITDFYSYNSYQSGELGAVGTLDNVIQSPVEPRERERDTPYGQHWVDDLALECLADVKGNSGSLVLELVRAGVHHRCEINVADGIAQLSRVDLSGEPLPFDGEGTAATLAKASTSLTGPGTFRIRLSNCDHQVLLWINGKVAAFDAPTTYSSEPLVMPRSTPADAGDLQPAAIGVKNLNVRLSQLRVFRDKYYIAQKQHELDQDSDYVTNFDEFLKSPNAWANHPYFTQRGFFDFDLGPDQFFPLGDNSPASQDARTWPGGYLKMPTPNYVERDLLIGKAMFVYWPHTWNAPIPYMPNPTQMRPIR